MPKSDFLGKGWSFPVSVDPVTGRVRTVAYDEDIAQSIRLILTTQKGQRVMRPDFGSRVRDFAFRELNATTLTLVEEDVRSALIQYEQRITQIAVKASPMDAEQGILNIEVSYVVRVTNSPFNLVFPYYLHEGMA